MGIAFHRMDKFSLGKCNLNLISCFNITETNLKMVKILFLSFIVKVITTYFYCHGENISTSP